MKRNGLIFIDIITALFIIGLIIAVVFPILSLTQESFTRHKNKAYMSYLSETTIESLNLKDEKALAFLEELEKSKELNYSHLKDDEYTLTVKLLSDNEYLWDLSVIVEETKESGSYVELKASIVK